MKPSSLTYDSFVADLKAEFPNVSIVSKKESRLMLLLCFVLKILTLGGQPTFMTAYTTTILNTIYTPTMWEYWDETRRIKILRHERVHLRQMKKWNPLVFGFLYLFIPLPFGLAYFRAKWEWEAYTESMRADAEYSGDVVLLNPAYKHLMVAYFTTGAYGWMWPFKKTVEKWYDDAADKILHGDG